MFICVLIIAALVAVQEMAARLGAYSGEGLMSLVREEFSLRIGAFAVVCLLVANLGLVVVGVRRHRRGDGDLRRVALHLGADRAR